MNTASHSSDVNNLASLSSDSGIQFGKTSEMSGSGDISGDSEKSPKHDQATPKLVVVQEDEQDDKKVLSGLKRSNSVKARANLFQQLENKLKQEKEVEKPPQKPKRGEENSFVYFRQKILKFSFYKF